MDGFEDLIDTQDVNLDLYGNNFMSSEQEEPMFTAYDPSVFLRLYGYRAKESI